MSAIKHYFSLHIRNGAGALADLRSQPIATSLTVLVIGIALALPAGLNLLVRNGRAVVGGWDSVRDFSVYLKIDATLAAAEALVDELIADESVSEITLITAEQALEDFRAGSSFDEVLDDLGSNPLPHTLVARPSAEATPEALAELERRLTARDDVDLVRIDTEWVARLNAILDFMRRGVLMVAVMLIGAVIVTVGNTIRLDIQNRRDEIEVCKLLGASNGFVRRPFLYLGFWYGAIGGIVALLLIGAGLLLLSGPLEQLTGLYESGLEFLGLDWLTTTAVLVGGVLAGWGGAWSAVSRHLAAIQPS